MHALDQSKNFRGGYFFALGVLDTLLPRKVPHTHDGWRSPTSWLRCAWSCAAWFSGSKAVGQ